MASIHWDKVRKGYRVQLYTHTGRRVMIWLGKCSRKQALEVKRHLEQLQIARKLGGSIDPKTIAWLQTISDRIRALLVMYDLIDAPKSSTIPTNLKEFLAFCVQENSSLAKNTLAKKKNAANHLCKFFGELIEIATITRGDADRFSRHLYATFLESTAGTNCREAKWFFKVAQRNNLLSINPFDDVRVSTVSDQSRREYVPKETITKLLDHCPNQLWRTILVLARFAGLAVPSEVVSLRWSLCDWQNHRFQVTKRKNIHHTNYVRVVPMFPEIHAELTKLFEEANEGNDWVCTRYRTGGASPFRDQLIKICANASIPPWPKLWINLRASCRTDLERIYPAHVCDAWLGHSSKVAAKHYSMVTEADFARACGVAGGVILDGRGVAGGVIIQPPATTSERIKGIKNQ